MGWTYYYSIKPQYEFDMLRKFYEAVYIEGEEICLAPTIADKDWFVWFADIDIKQTEPLDIAYVKLLCETVAITVSKFYPRLAAGKSENTNSMLPLVIVF